MTDHVYQRVLDEVHVMKPEDLAKLAETLGERVDEEIKRHARRTRWQFEESGEAEAAETRVVSGFDPGGPPGEPLIFVVPGADPRFRRGGERVEPPLHSYHDPSTWGDGVGPRPPTWEPNVGPVRLVEGDDGVFREET